MKKPSTTQTQPLRTQLREFQLFLLFLAVGTGAVVFFFFIGSRDMKTAQFRSQWTLNLAGLFDKIANELENAAQVDFPLQGSGTQCLYRRPSADWALGASLEQEAFLFAEKGLFHLARNASGSLSHKSFQTLENPLLSGVQSLQFERLNPRLLRISARLTLNDRPENVVNLVRDIFLRNQ